jgi:hypothetical protein
MQDTKYKITDCFQSISKEELKTIIQKRIDMYIKMRIQKQGRI